MIVNIATIPHMRIQQLAHVITIITEMASSMEEFYLSGEAKQQMNAETLISLAMGRLMTSRDYVLSQKARTYFLELWAALFKVYNIDAVLTPTTATRAPPIADDVLPYGETNLEVTTRIMRYAYVANFIGLPALTVPIDTADNVNVPMGLQIMAEHWREDVAFRIAGAMEDIRLTKYGKNILKPQVQYRILDDAAKLAKTSDN